MIVTQRKAYWVLPPTVREVPYALGVFIYAYAPMRSTFREKVAHFLLYFPSHLNILLLLSILLLLLFHQLLWSMQCHGQHASCFIWIFFSSWVFHIIIFSYIVLCPKYVQGRSYVLHHLKNLMGFWVIIQMLYKSSDLICCEGLFLEVHTEFFVTKSATSTVIHLFQSDWLTMSCFK